MPRVKGFYLKCCEYVAENAHAEFKNPPVGVPKTYIKAHRKIKTNKRKKKNKTSKIKKGNKSYAYKYNDHLTPYLHYSKDKLFSTDNVSSFLHKRKSDVRVGTRRQRFFKPPEVATDFYNSFPELFNQFEDFDLNRHFVVEGCFETNRHTIQEQMHCTNFDGAGFPNISHYNLMEVALRDSVRKLQIEEFKGVDISDIREFDFNLDTKPGFRYEHYLLKESKRDCVNEAVYLAEERYMNIVNATKEGRRVNRDEIIPGIYTIGARNKRETEPEVGENLVSRAVHMPEFHVELHGGIFCDLITTDIVEKQKGPIFIGNSFLKSERFESLLNDNFCAIEGDWKKFDSTLCNALVIMALSICRCYFPEGDLYDNHFIAILDSLVIKDYHVVGGSVYRLLHGLPSGSKWTNLLGSKINLIALNYTFSNIKYNERSFAVGGDDFVVFSKNEIYNFESLLDIAVSKAELIGMNFKFLKQKLFKNSNNIDDYPVFYKYTVFKGNSIIPCDAILERTLSPWNKKYYNNYDILIFLDNILPSLGFPSSGCFIYYYFYQYVYFRLTGKKISLNTLITKHFNVYHRMVNVGSTIKEIKSFFLKTESSKRNIFIYSAQNTTYLKQLFFCS